MQPTCFADAAAAAAAAEVPGYKGLLVDKDTMRVCSTLFGRTELAEHSVVHVERLDSNDGKHHPELKVRLLPAWTHTA